MMDLIEFVAELSLRLDDKGVVLKQVTDDEVAGFCSLVEDVFATWNKDVSDQAARNQRELRDRYQQWTQRLKQRIKANNTWLSQNVPDFDWQQHYQDPEHLNRLCARPMENLKQEEENISQWRKQNFHKLYWLRDQARKANEESDRLVTDLDNSRRKNYKQLMLVNMNREMLHEKHAALQYEVKQLKEKRNKLSDKVGDLFAELENVNRPSSPCLCGESARRSSSSRR